MQQHNISKTFQNEEKGKITDFYLSTLCALHYNSAVPNKLPNKILLFAK